MKTLLTFIAMLILLVVFSVSDLIDSYNSNAPADSTDRLDTSTDGHTTPGNPLDMQNTESQPHSARASP